MPYDGGSPDPLSKAASHFFGWLCWMPLASLLATEAYVSNFDGMGAWAAAPLFLLPLFLSLVLAGAGVAQYIFEWRRGAARTSTMVFTFVAALPVLWLLVRRFVV